MPTFNKNLAEIESESMGWTPFEPGAYLHVSNEGVAEVQVVGVPQAADAVLLLMS